jgi:hypothetical protein
MYAYDRLSQVIKGCGSLGQVSLGYVSLVQDIA